MTATRLVLWIIIAVFVGELLRQPYDDSDAPPSRSGLKVMIDRRTGCHYLGNAYFGITQRMDKTGKQICEATP